MGEVNTYCSIADGEVSDAISTKWRPPVPRTDLNDAGGVSHCLSMAHHHQLHEVLAVRRYR